MIYSMTGYANQVIQIASTTLQIDIRSVNQRFLDITIKCPEEFKPLEQEIRDKITAVIKRGKIDLRIHYQEQENNKISLNIDVLNHYIRLTEQIQEHIPQAKLDNINQIISLPGILNTTALDIELIKTDFLNEINTLANNLQTTQAQEGTKLSVILMDRIEQIEKIVTDMQKIMPSVRKSYQERLKNKLLETLAEAVNNEQRFLQEFAYFCQKIDVDEELSRLHSHLKAFKDLLSAGGAVGKRLDFITQEMHREANTFGAKSAALATTVQSIELKVLIEQIKEQIQNIV